MPAWNCRIGRVTPKLTVHEGGNVQDFDPYDRAGFVEDVISAVRDNGAASGFSVVVSHSDGSVTCGSRGVRQGSDFQMIGAMAYELVRLCNRVREGQG